MKEKIQKNNPKKPISIAICFTLVLFLLLIFYSKLASAETQYLTYENSEKGIDLSYDLLDRILTTVAPGINIFYTYDQQYDKTLTSVTFNGMSYSYEYDDRLRVIREVKTIDGITFEKRNYYDSMNRLVEQSFTPGRTIEYTYNDQGKITTITGLISSSVYNAFDQILTRNYNNGLVTQYAYDDETGRLTQIKTGDLQQLDYSYDDVGNVIEINDTANNKKYNMEYDFLDRLVKAIINDNVYEYIYNSIGNIMKIIKPEQTMEFVYGTNPIHAPSQITIILPEYWSSTSLSLEPSNPMIWETVDVSCLVKDFNTSEPVSDYPVDIYVDNDLIFSGVSDSKGFVNTSWVARSGVHIIKCQIEDYPDRFYHALYSDSASIEPSTRGKIAFLCKYDNCRYSKEDEIIDWLTTNGWEVNSKMYKYWTLEDFTQHDLIVCYEQSYACNIGSTTDAYIAHKNYQKPIVELSYATSAKAAHRLGYITSYSGSYANQEYITIAKQDPITYGYSGNVNIFSSNKYIANIYHSKLTPLVISLANTSSTRSALFKVDSSDTNGRFAWLGWFYKAYPSDLNDDGRTIFMRVLNWAQCDNVDGCTYTKPPEETTSSTTTTSTTTSSTSTTTTSTTSTTSSVSTTTISTTSITTTTSPPTDVYSFGSSLVRVYQNPTDTSPPTNTLGGTEFTATEYGYVNVIDSTWFSFRSNYGSIRIQTQIPQGMSEAQLEVEARTQYPWYNGQATFYIWNYLISSWEVASNTFQYSSGVWQDITMVKGVSQSNGYMDASGTVNMLIFCNTPWDQWYYVDYGEVKITSSSATETTTTTPTTTSTTTTIETCSLSSSICSNPDGSITLGETLSGCLKTTDWKYYKILGTAGKEVNVTLTYSGTDCNKNDLYVYDDDCNTLYVSSSNDWAVNWTGTSISDIKVGIDGDTTNNDNCQWTLTVSEINTNNPQSDVYSFGSSLVRVYQNPTDTSPPTNTLGGTEFTATEYGYVNVIDSTWFSFRSNYGSIRIQIQIPSGMSQAQIEVKARTQYPWYNGQATYYIWNYLTSSWEVASNTFQYSSGVWQDITMVKGVSQSNGYMDASGTVNMLIFCNTPWDQWYYVDYGEVKITG